MTQIELVSETITQQVYSRLKSQIHRRELPPGSRLVTTTIANEMGVSLTPVREALRSLEKDGLVENRPHRGAVVAGVSRRELEELFSVRTPLEALAARTAAANRDADLKPLEEALTAARDAVAKHDMNAWLEADLQFHRAIAVASDNRELLRIIESLRERLRRFLHASRFWSNVPDGADEHEAIYDAIKHHKAGQAEKLMKQHLDESLRHAIERGVV